MKNPRFITLLPGGVVLPRALFRGDRSGWSSSKPSDKRPIHIVLDYATTPPTIVSHFQGARVLREAKNPPDQFIYRENIYKRNTDNTLTKIF